MALINDGIIITWGETKLGKLGIGNLADFISKQNESADLINNNNSLNKTTKITSSSNLPPTLIDSIENITDSTLIVFLCYFVFI